MWILSCTSHQVYYKYFEAETLEPNKHNDIAENELLLLFCLLFRTFYPFINYYHTPHSTADKNAICAFIAENRSGSFI